MVYFEIARKVFFERKERNMFVYFPAEIMYFFLMGKNVKERE